MDHNTPHIVVEGMEHIIKRDLDKSKLIIDTTKTEQLTYRASMSTEIQRKRSYKKLIGGKKYNDVSLREAISQMNINIRHMQDKIHATEEKIKHHTLIVDTLTEQLKNQMEGLRVMREDLLKEKDAIRNRLGEQDNPGNISNN